MSEFSLTSKFGLSDKFVFRDMLSSMFTLDTSGDDDELGDYREDRF